MHEVNHHWADPVSNRLAQAYKVGPHGYEHGWRFVGVPGSEEHRAAVSELGGHIADDQASAAVGNAASAMERQDYAAAADHLKNAAVFTQLAGDHASTNSINAAVQSLAGLHSRAKPNIQPLSPHRPLSVPRNPEPASYREPGRTPRQTFESFSSTPSEAAFNAPSNRDFWGRPTSKKSEQLKHWADPVANRLAAAHSEACESC